MGPGYFPLALGVLLAVLGGVITFKALVVETVDGDKIGAFAWRPLIFIILANLVFGAMIGGLPSICLLSTSPSPRDRTRSRMQSSACNKKTTHTHTHIAVR